jgi:transposase InsO family protein
MATPLLNDRTSKLIHHSDRGVQYCSINYVQGLQAMDIAVSMGEVGSAYENPVAERVNGILKQEFALDRLFTTHEEATRAVKSAVRLYNQKRPHMSCDYLTPEVAHQQSGKLNKRWKAKKYSGKKSFKEIASTMPVA